MTTYLQLCYHHCEWLVSSVTVNYAASDLLAQEHFASFRYTTAARLNHNLTLGISYLVGDTWRNLAYAQELSVFAIFKL